MSDTQMTQDYTSSNLGLFLTFSSVLQNKTKNLNAHTSVDEKWQF